MTRARRALGHGERPRRASEEGVGGINGGRGFGDLVEEQRASVGRAASSREGTRGGSGARSTPGGHGGVHGGRGLCARQGDKKNRREEGKLREGDALYSRTRPSDVGTSIRGAAYVAVRRRPRGGRRTEVEGDPDGWAPPVSDSEKDPLYLCFLPYCKLPF